MKSHIFVLVAALFFLSADAMYVEKQTQSGIDQLLTIKHELELIGKSMSAREYNELISEALDIQNTINVVGTEEHKRQAETLVKEITQVILEMSALKIAPLFDKLAGVYQELRKTAQERIQQEKGCGKTCEREKGATEDRFKELEIKAKDLIKKIEQAGILPENVQQKIKLYSEQIEQFSKAQQEQLEKELMQMQTKGVEEEEKEKTGTVEELRKKWKKEFPEFGEKKGKK